MTELRIAGHTFTGTMDDVCQTLLPNGEPCRRTWAEIENATDEDVNKNGYAHVSYLSAGELAEIRAEKQRRADVVARAWSAVVDLCG